MSRVILAIVLVSVALFGCGSKEGTLNTTMASVTLDSSLLDSDVIKWTDATACTGASTPAPDEVNATLTVTPYVNSTGNALPVRVEKATIYYSPASSNSVASPTPNLPPLYQVIGQVIQPGSTLSIPVRVATTELKEQFQPVLACATPIYNYYVTIVFDLTEIGGKSSTISTAMQLRFADYTDK